MFRKGKIRAPIAWVLLFAVLFNIASSALAMQRRAQDALGMSDICSTRSLGAITPSGVDRAPGDHGDLMHDGHCQLCTIHHGACLLPVIASVLPLAAGTSHQPPLPPLSVSTSRPACPPPPSHGPPAFS